jgi:hypothetical protein
MATARPAQGSCSAVASRRASRLRRSVTFSFCGLGDSNTRPVSCQLRRRAMVGGPRARRMTRPRSVGRKHCPRALRPARRLCARGSGLLPGSLSAATSACSPVYISVRRAFGYPPFAARAARPELGLPALAPRQRGEWAPARGRLPHGAERSQSCMLAHVKRASSSCPATGNHPRPHQPDERPLPIANASIATRPLVSTGVPSKVRLSQPASGP